VQPEYPRRSRTRNQNDDGEGNADVAIRRLLKRNAIASNQMRIIATAKATRVAPKKFASSTPADAPTAVATIRSSEGVRVARPEQIALRLK